jgi:hypothetical protein
MTTDETRSGGAPPVTWTFPGKYISVTTYRRDGTALATPLWFVQSALHLGRRRSTPVILAITPR